MKNYESIANEGDYQTNDMKDHLTTLYFIVKEFKCKNILELGVGDFGTYETGRSTVALLEGVSENSGCLTSVDIGPCVQTRNKIQELGLSQNWRFFVSDTLSFTFEEELDLLYIDDEHTYKQLHSELFKFAKFLKSGGFIIIHDTWNHNNYDMGKELRRAIDDFLNVHHNYTRYEWFNCYGLTVLRKW